MIATPYPFIPSSTDRKEHIDAILQQGHGHVDIKTMNVKLSVVHRCLHRYGIGTR